MIDVQLALVFATFLLAAATFWMGYVSYRHVRLTRVQYLVDRTPLIEPRVEGCKRNGDILSATLVIENAGASAIVIHRVGIRSQNDRRPGPSRAPAPERPYPMVVATVHRGHVAHFSLELPVTDDDLTVDPEEQPLLNIGLWTAHVYLSILGFPGSLETWTVFARVQYEEGKFPVNLTTFGPILDERNTREKLQDWLKRLFPRSVVARLGRRKRRH